IHADGTYSYSLKLEEVEAEITEGGTLTESFPYTFTVGTQTFTAFLTFTIVDTPDGLELTDNFNSIDITGSVSGGDGRHRCLFARDALVTGALDGGAGADTFIIKDTALLTGAVAGGSSPPGSADALDFSAAAGPVVVDLAAGTSNVLLGALSGIEN